MDNFSKTNVSDLPIEVCECGNKIWIQGLILKKVSSLISQSGRPEVMPVPVFMCSKCGELAPMLKNDPRFNDIMCNNKKIE